MKYEIGYICFINGFSQKWYDDIYDAMIYGYQKSFNHLKKFPDTTHKYSTVIYKYNKYPTYEYSETCVCVVHHQLVRKIKLIQRFYRSRFKRKMDAVIFLQYHLRKAISCPYTQLCRKRLLREFRDLTTN